MRVESYDRIDEAARALNANSAARLFGGGTLLMRAVNYGSQSFNLMIRVTDPAFKEIRLEGDRITLGAGVSMAQIMSNRDLAFLAPAARAVGGPAVRNAATIGGNINVKSPYGDFATAPLALGAEVHIAGQTGSQMSIDDFLRDRDTQPGRMVRAITIQRPQEANAFRFLKVSRIKPKGISLLSIAALLPRGRTGNRIAYCNMGPAPARATAVERALEGAVLDATGIQPALAAATEGLSPPTDSLASEWYRREVAPVHLRRLLLGETG